MSKLIRYAAYTAAIFLGLHALSVAAFFAPAIGPIFYWLLLGLSAAAAFWRPQLAAVPVILNLILDSSGHLFEWRGLSLRLLLLVLTLLAWAYHSARAHELSAKLRTPFTAVYALLMAVVALAAYNGIRHGHDPHLIIADLVPVLYLSLFYPLRDLLPALLQKRISAGIIIGSFLGASALSVIVLFLFSSGLTHVGDAFYAWWRDVAVGKATSTGNGFFRIVTPLHLFLTALLPYFVYRLMAWSKESGKNFSAYALLLMALLVPVINFSRIYFLALIPATLCMALCGVRGRQRTADHAITLKKAVAVLLAIGFLSITEYTAINLMASRGQSLGFEFLYGQSRGIVNPESEASAGARAAILPHLIEKIKNRPLSGEGLAATVTYYNVFLQKELTTPHLDWGYLEMAVEYGLPAAALFISLMLWLLWHVRQNPPSVSILAFLAVTTLTAPALFHVYGMVLIAFILAISSPFHSYK